MMPCDACTHDYERHHEGSGFCRDCVECMGYVATEEDES